MRFKVTYMNWQVHIYSSTEHNFKEKVIQRVKNVLFGFFSFSVLGVIFVLKSCGYEHVKCTLELMSG